MHPPGGSAGRRIAGPRPGAPLRLLDAVVRPEWVDYNRHMSDFRYAQVFGDAVEPLFRQIGVDEAYRATGRMYYTVENHIRHLGEAKVGESLYVTAQVLEADDKRLHIFQRMFRGRDDKQIATADQMYLHVDTAAAKASVADPKVRAKAEQILRAQAALPPPAEAGRAVGLGKRLDRAMPKIVDHAKRRDEIAQVACQVVANYGFEQATVARIARAAGYTTGMVAHYYESKQEIILAACA
jgi:acyl-CoA thioesterase FadM